MEAISAKRHDVYLFDYHLGRHDGLELLRKAITLGLQSPVIMLTGQGGRVVDLEAMELGAYDYLIKGQITPNMLERAIRYALQHADSTVALRQTVQISSALLTAINHLDRGVMITDPLQDDNPVIFVNDFFLEMTRYARHEDLGRNSRFLQGAATDPREVTRMNQAITQGEIFQGRLHNYRKSGEVFLNELVIFPVRDNDGKISKFVSLCVGQDITDEPDA